MAPSMSANTIPMARISGPMRISKLLTLKVTKFPRVVVTRFSGSTIRQASTPPTSESINDSRKKLNRILPLVKPRMRSVPISLDLRATAAYIVFIEAKQLPTAMMMQTKKPRNWIGRAETV